MDIVTATKRYVTEDRHRLRLFEAVAAEARTVVEALKGEQFSGTLPWSQEAFRARITAFDNVVADLCRVQAVIGRWGNGTSNASLTRHPTHV